MVGSAAMEVATLATTATVIESAAVGASTVAFIESTATGISLWLLTFLLHKGNY